MVLRVDHDVRRFQIAMDDAGLVRGGEAGGDLAGEQQDARQRQPRLALQQGRQVGALHVLHREVERALDVAQVVDADHVGMGHLARQFQFTLEAILELSELRTRGGGVDANELERDRRAERFVPGLVDRGHAAGAEQPDDGVTGPELLTGRQDRSAHRRTRDSRSSRLVGQSGKRGVQTWRGGCRLVTAGLNGWRWHRFGGVRVGCLQARSRNGSVLRGDGTRVTDGTSVGPGWQCRAAAAAVHGRDRVVIIYTAEPVGGAHLLTEQWFTWRGSLCPLTGGDYGRW